jgi:predicted phage terminase large subunit-like protein
MAKGETDWNVVVTTGKDLVEGGIFVLDVWRRKCGPKEVIDEIFHQVQKWNPLKVGIEAIQYQASLIHFIKEQMREQGKYFVVYPITHGRKSKGDRIRGLQPLVASGMLRFRRSHQALVTELLIYPYKGNEHDDMADCLSMQIPMWGITKTRRQTKDQDTSRDLFVFDDGVEKRVRANSATHGPVQWSYMGRAWA